MADTVETRELAVSHADFYRLIARTVFNPEHVRLDKNNARAVLPFRRGEIVISLEQERTRVIGSLSLPATRLHFEFRGLERSEISEYLDRFARSFHRGGG